MNKSILVVGSINADLYVDVARLPKVGETVRGQDAEVFPGGKGANQAVAAARLGVETWFAGKLGSDAYAPLLETALENAGVHSELVQQMDGPSGQAIILSQPNSGDNAIIVIGGANQEWYELDDVVHERLRDVGALLLQCEIPESINLEAAHAARSAGVPVILDVGGNGGKIMASLLPLVDILSPNEHELAVLSGMPTTTNEEILSAARALQAQGAHSLLIKLGARGAMLVPENGKPLVHAAFAVKTVDSTGAGDCFTAAYAVATVGGMQPQARLRFACAAAALSVMRKGAIPSMPSREAVKRFLMSNTNEPDLTAYE
jgi:ribokinase